MDTLRARLETFWGEREATRLEQHARGDARFDLREVYRRFEDLSAGERLDETAGWLEEETLASRQDGPRRLLALSRSIVLDAASAERAFAAAEAEDSQRVFDLGEVVYQTCNNCHSIYWVDDQDRGRAIEPGS